MVKALSIGISSEDEQAEIARAIDYVKKKTGVEYHWEQDSKRFSIAAITVYRIRNVANTTGTEIQIAQAFSLGQRGAVTDEIKCSTFITDADLERTVAKAEGLDTAANLRQKNLRLQDELKAAISEREEAEKDLFAIDQELHPVRSSVNAWAEEVSQLKKMPHLPSSVDDLVFAPAWHTADDNLRELVGFAHFTSIAPPLKAISFTNGVPTRAVSSLEALEALRAHPVRIPFFQWDPSDCSQGTPAAESDCLASELTKVRSQVAELKLVARALRYIQPLATACEADLRRARLEANTPHLSGLVKISGWLDGGNRLVLLHDTATWYHKDAISDAPVNQPITIEGQTWLLKFHGLGNPHQPGTSDAVGPFIPRLPDFPLIVSLGESSPGISFNAASTQPGEIDLDMSRPSGGLPHEFKVQVNWETQEP
jgi:hypothetical protein